jgi:hypothetical protein
MIREQIMYRCKLFWDMTKTWLYGKLTYKLSKDEKMSVAHVIYKYDVPYKSYRGSYLGFVKWIFTEPFDWS